MVSRRTSPAERRIVGPGCPVSPEDPLDQITRKLPELPGVGLHRQGEDFPSTQEFDLPSGRCLRENIQDRVGQYHQLDADELQVDGPATLVLGKKILPVHAVQAIHPDVKAVAAPIRSQRAFDEDRTPFSTLGPSMSPQEDGAGLFEILAGKAAPMFFQVLKGSSDGSPVPLVLSDRRMDHVSETTPGSPDGERLPDLIDKVPEELW